MGSLAGASAPRSARPWKRPCVTNVWIPDGCKDTPIDRKGPRQRLAESLDAIFAEPLDRQYIRDAVEGKLFGLGSESYVVGSQSFTWVMPSRATSFCASTPAIIIPPRSSRTRSRRCSCTLMKFCCTSAVAFAGTATTWWSSPTSSRR